MWFVWKAQANLCGRHWRHDQKAPREVFVTIAEKFEKLDRNQDGFLTRSEAASDPALWSRFGSYDRDKDTQLSLSEYSLYASK